MTIIIPPFHPSTMRSATATAAAAAAALGPRGPKATPPTPLDTEGCGTCPPPRDLLAKTRGSERCGGVRVALSPVHLTPLHLNYHHCHHDHHLHCSLCFGGELAPQNMNSD
ncbi:hypothetical protein E2C01_091190 [Portunus trituberculatus]|uniref:Uncharacterized protein n=1 Tax=Portunus trituberculatus TaxID=210409 RepID=A0A5B7JGQ8_PORTR|nr:hypothetical protein [Portunus trituberculatus]